MVVQVLVQAGRASAQATRTAGQAGIKVGRTGARAGAKGVRAGKRAAKRSGTGFRKAGARATSKTGARTRRSGARGRPLGTQRRPARGRGAPHRQGSRTPAGRSAEASGASEHRPHTPRAKHSAGQKQTSGRAGGDADKPRSQARGAPAKRVRKVARAGLDELADNGGRPVGSGRNGGRRPEGRLNQAMRSVVGSDLASANADHGGGIDLEAPSRMLTGRGGGALMVLVRSMARSLQRALRRGARMARRLVLGPLLFVMTLLVVVVIIAALAGTAFNLMGEGELERQEALEASLSSCAPGSVDAGAGVGPSQALGPDALSARQVAALADYGLRRAGVSDPSAMQLQLATAIARGESGWEPTEHNPVPPDNSYGLWQINMIGELGPDRRQQFGLDSDEELWSPKINAIAMAHISHGGTSWNPWTVYRDDTYLEWMDALQPVAHEIADMGADEVDGIADEVDDTVPPDVEPIDPDEQHAGDVVAAACTPGGGLTADCPAGVEPRGGTEAYPRNPDEQQRDWMETAATKQVRDAVLQCFGRGTHFSCYDRRDGESWEHPRGRACDFGITPIGTRRATGSDLAHGDTLANWLVANAERYHVIQVLWNGRMWMNGGWQDLSCNPNCSITSGHHDHVHVSVATMPGDPPHAHCDGRSQCNP